MARMYLSWLWGIYLCFSRSLTFIIGRVKDDLRWVPLEFEQVLYVFVLTKMKSMIK